MTLIFKELWMNGARTMLRKLDMCAIAAWAIVMDEEGRILDKIEENERMLLDQEISEEKEWELIREINDLLSKLEKLYDSLAGRG